MLYDKHFPITVVKTRSSDHPWITKRIKRHIRNRRREFARNGRSRAWKRKKERCEELIAAAKKAYFEKVKKELRRLATPAASFRQPNS